MHSWTLNSRVYLLAFTSYLGAFIFGYDTGVAGGVLRMPGFQHDFGLDRDDDAKVIAITSHVVSALQGGCFFGAILAAPLSERLGRKISLLVVSAVFLVGAAVQVVAIHNLWFIYCGRFISGLGVGAMSMLGPTYVAEVSPKNVRGRITGLFQVFIAIGITISYWIVYGANRHIAASAKQWRIPIGFQVVPVSIMFILLWFCRESPRWLARAGKENQALVNLAWFRKLPIDNPAVLDEFVEILVTAKEKFLIALSMFILQQFSGQNSVGYYAPQVFSSIGISSTSSALLASGVYGIVKVVATTVFLFVGIERFGRRRPLMVGGLLMGVFLFILGGLLHTQSLQVGATVSGRSVAMAVMIYLYVIPYCFSWGPVCWVYCSEMFSNRLRSNGMAFAAATQWLFNFVVTLITPNLFSELPGGGAFILFASINILSTLYAYFLPETSRVSLEEMDVLFGAKTRETWHQERHAMFLDLHADHGLELTLQMSKFSGDDESITSAKELGEENADPESVFMAI